MALFDSTIADNIARFEEPPDAAAIIATAQAADVHEMILRLPDGYDDAARGRRHGAVGRPAAGAGGRSTATRSS